MKLKNNKKVTKFIDYQNRELFTRDSMLNFFPFFSLSLFSQFFSHPLFINFRIFWHLCVPSHILRRKLFVRAWQFFIVTKLFSTKNPKIKTNVHPQTLSQKSVFFLKHHCLSESFFAPILSFILTFFFQRLEFFFLCTLQVKSCSRNAGDRCKSAVVDTICKKRKREGEKERL